jgi:hypothetical protein
VSTSTARFANKTSLIFALIFAATGAQAGAMKKCVDASGKTLYYGDTIPPDLLPKCKNLSELSNKGIEKKKTEYLNAEERKAKADEDAAKKAEKQKEVDQARKDKALLATYTTEKEIDLTRDRNLKPLDLQIQTLQDDLKKAKGANVQRVQAQIDQKKLEREAVRQRFEADKVRFRELTGTTPPAPPKGAPIVAPKPAQ